MFTTYAIYNKQRNKIYIGHTFDIGARIRKHNQELPNKNKSFTHKNRGNGN